jgi:hypothetical protein
VWEYACVCISVKNILDTKANPVAINIHNTKIEASEYISIKRKIKPDVMAPDCKQSTNTAKERESKLQSQLGLYSDEYQKGNVAS